MTRRITFWFLVLGNSGRKCTALGRKARRNPASVAPAARSVYLVCMNKEAGTSPLCDGFIAEIANQSVAIFPPTPANFLNQG
jgi:hypothetical protein